MTTLPHQHALAALTEAAAVVEAAEARILAEDARRILGDVTDLRRQAASEGDTSRPLGVLNALTALTLDLEALVTYLEDQR